MTRRPRQSHANMRADWSFSTGVVIPGQPQKCSQAMYPWVRAGITGPVGTSRSSTDVWEEDETPEQVRTSPFLLRKCSSVSCTSRTAGVKLNHDFSDSSYRRLVACCIPPPTEGGRTGSWSWNQTCVTHIHVCDAAAAGSCSHTGDTRKSGNFALKLK